MSKSIKLKDGTYWDSSSVTHYKQPLKDNLDTINTVLRNISGVFDFGILPKTTTIANINKNIFGIYTVCNDDNAPHNNKENDWFTVINIPANQGTNYSVQIAFSYWGATSSTYGIWIKYGRGTESSSWYQVPILNKNNKLRKLLTTSNQGSWIAIPNAVDGDILTFVISSSSYNTVISVPRDIITQYNPSSPMRFNDHNGNIIGQLAYSDGNIILYGWTSGYTYTVFAKQM